MKSPVLAMLLLCIPSFARADCVTPKDLTTGIAFTRQDGRNGTVQAEGKGLTIDYAAGTKTAWQDFRRTTMGVYDLTWAWSPTEEYYVGGGPGGSYNFKFSGKPPVPVAGKNWKTTLRVAETQDNGTEYGPQTYRYNYDVTYSFQDTKEVKLSGCPYTVMPVEATFIGKSEHLTRRWIYFPDLGFGLETRVIDHTSGEDRKLGLTAMKPKG